MNAKDYIVTEYSEGRGPNRRAVRIYSQAFDPMTDEAQYAIENFATAHPEFNIRAKLGTKSYTFEDEERNTGFISVQNLLSPPLEEETSKLVTKHQDFPIF